MTEPRLAQVLTAGVARVMTATLAAFVAVVIAAYGVTTEIQLERSLERSADVVGSLLGLYADPTGQPTTVAPDMLVDQLLEMDEPFLITREAGSDDMRKIYFLSPNMPAKQLAGLVPASPEEVRDLLLREIATRARWRYRVLHREAGDFDIFILSSRAPLLTGLLVLLLAALGLLPIAWWAGRRATIRVVAGALQPMQRIAATTRSIGPDRLDLRLATPTGQVETTQLADDINRMLDRLEAAHTQLRAFTADASHELRTPLTHLRAQVQWSLADDRPPEAMRESLTAIARDLERTTRMVEDLLLIARGENGQLPCDSQPFVLQDLLSEVVEIAQAMAGIHGVELQVSTDSTGPTRVLGDPQRARHALLNLIANALRYTTGRCVRLGFRTDGARCGVTVEDDGPGIPASCRERIFDRFFRVEGSRSRAHGGTGLGLTIARLLARLQGGDITLEPTPAGGSAFTLWLPVAPAP